MAVRKTVAGLVILFVFAAGGFTVSAGSDKAKDWQKVLDQAKISLGQAIQKAEQETKGRSISAEMGLEGRTVIIDVLVLKGGEKPGLVEVEVNGETGKIQEVESKDDGDEDEDDDDDGDDDDNDDDDNDDDD